MTSGAFSFTKTAPSSPSAPTLRSEIKPRVTAASGIAPVEADKDLRPSPTKQTFGVRLGSKASAIVPSSAARPMQQGSEDTPNSDDHHESSKPVVSTTRAPVFFGEAAARTALNIPLSEATMIPPPQKPNPEPPYLAYCVERPQAYRVAGVMGKTTALAYDATRGNLFVASVNAAIGEGADRLRSARRVTLHRMRSTRAGGLPEQVAQISSVIGDEAAEAAKFRALPRVSSFVPLVGAEYVAMLLSRPYLPGQVVVLPFPRVPSEYVPGDVNVLGASATSAASERETNIDKGNKIAPQGDASPTLDPFGVKGELVNMSEDGDSELHVFPLQHQRDGACNFVFCYVAQVSRHDLRRRVPWLTVYSLNHSAGSVESRRFQVSQPKENVYLVQIMGYLHHTNGTTDLLLLMFQPGHNNRYPIHTVRVPDNLRATEPHSLLVLPTRYLFDVETTPNTFVTRLVQCGVGSSIVAVLIDTHYLRLYDVETGRAVDSQPWGIRCGEWGRNNTAGICGICWGGGVLHIAHDEGNQLDYFITRLYVRQVTWRVAAMEGLMSRDIKDAVRTVAWLRLNGERTTQLTASDQAGCGWSELPIELFEMVLETLWRMVEPKALVDDAT